MKLLKVLLLAATFGSSANALAQTPISGAPILYVECTVTNGIGEADRDYTSQGVEVSTALASDGSYQYESTVAVTSPSDPSDVISIGTLYLKRSSDGYTTLSDGTNLVRYHTGKPKLFNPAPQNYSGCVASEKKDELGQPTDSD